MSYKHSKEVGKTLDRLRELLGLAAFS